MASYLNPIVSSPITDPAEFSWEKILVKHFFSANLNLNKVEISLGCDSHLEFLFPHSPALSPSGTVITVKLVETASNAIIDERNYTITYPTSTLTPIATPTEPGQFDSCVL